MLWLAFSFLFGETVPFCLAVIYLNRFHWCEYKGRPFVWPPDKTSTWFVWAALIIIRHGALCFIRGFWVFVQNAHVLIYLFYMQRQNSVEETLTYRNGNDITGTPYSLTVFSTYVSLSGLRAQWDFKNCLEELAHMFFYVKLNFKLGLFSSTFWFEHSLRSENAYL